MGVMSEYSRRAAWWEWKDKEKDPKSSAVGDWGRVSEPGRLEESFRALCVSPGLEMSDGNLSKGEHK